MVEKMQSQRMQDTLCFLKGMRFWIRIFRAG